jgi:4-hydroxybenzoate polyprenyltransferase
MPTPEWFMSAIDLLVRYLRQRARLGLFVPLSVLLAVAGRSMVASSSASVGAIVVAALQALALTLAFRIWDDIEDLDVDRVRHPTRVAVTARTTAPLSALGLLLASGATISLIAEPFVLRRLAALSFVTAILSIWYGARPREGRHALSEHVLAMKYPLVAYAVAPELPSDVVTPRVAIVLVVLYVLICVYEYAEDVELRQLLTSRRSAS